jgi:hypothetical protein
VEPCLQTVQMDKLTFTYKHAYGVNKKLAKIVFCSLISLKRHNILRVCKIILISPPF